MAEQRKRGLKNQRESKVEVELKEEGRPHPRVEVGEEDWRKARQRARAEE